MDPLHVVTATLLTDTFLQHLVHIHKLCLTPPPEYPDILNSQLLVLSRTYGKIAEKLEDNANVFAAQGYDHLYQSCLDDCAIAAKELEEALKQYGDVVNNEKKWNETAKPTVVKLHALVAAITPLMRLATGQNVAVVKKVLDKLAADTLTLNDAGSTLTGETVLGEDEKLELKSISEKDEDMLSKDEKPAHKPSVELTNGITNGEKSKHGSMRSHVFYRLVNTIYAGKFKGELALHQACEKGSKFNVKRLLYNGADPELRATDGRTALHYASKSGQEKTTRILLDWNVDINVQDGKGLSPLLLSVTTKNDNVAKILLDAGANTELADDSEFRALHRAAQTNRTMLSPLLAAGADVNSVGSGLSCPLHLAVSKNQIETVKQLLAAGADVDAPDLKQETPLHIAVRNGRENIVTLLLDHGADIDALGLRWETALTSAVKWGNLSIMKILVDRGANLELENTEKHRAMHFAVFWNRADMIKVLLDAGAEVDARGRFGETPLTLACQDGFMSCAVKLLAAGASIQLEQSSPKGIMVGNALACARKWARSAELTELLEKMEKGEIEKIVEEDYKAKDGTMRDPTAIKDWMGKFVVQVYERESGKGEVE